MTENLIWLMRATALVLSTTPWLVLMVYSLSISTFHAIFVG